MREKQEEGEGGYEESHRRIVNRRRRTRRRDCHKRSSKGGLQDTVGEHKGKKESERKNEATTIEMNYCLLI